MIVLRSLLLGIFAVSVCVAQTINISGRVTDTGGTPLPGAIVTLVNAGLTATTGAEGNFTLTNNVGVRRQNNQLPTHGLSAGIYNGVLYVNLQEESDVEISTFTLQGKVISTLRRTMGAGTNSLALPRMGAGVYLYKVKFCGSEFMTKSPLIDGISHGTAISVQSLSSNALTKQAKSTAAFNDAILVTKDGYSNYRMLITNSDTSGIEIKMMVGNPAISAMLYNPGGSPAVHAKVRFYPINYNPLTGGLAKTLAAVVDSTTTDAHGNYTAKLDTGTYNVLAAGDSGVVYQDSITVIKDSTVHPPADTLKAPGGLRGRVRLQPGDDARTVFILFLGTNTWGTPDDSTGKFTVTNMAEGTYRVRFLTTLDAYLPKDTVLSVTAGKVDTLGHDIVLQ